MQARKPGEMFCVACGQPCTGADHEAVSYVDASVGHFRECTVCGTLNVVESVDYDALYADRTSTNYASGRTGLLSRVLMTLKGWVMGFALRQLLGRRSRDLRLLDYGCGSGDLANAALALGVQQVYACDVQAERPETLDATVRYFASDRPPLGVQFDLIVLRHVLEHIVDPRQALAALLPQLAPGGRIVVEVPASRSVLRRLLGRRWPGYFFPYHVTVFSEPGMAALVRRCGLEVTEAWHCTPPIVGPLLISLGVRRGAARLLSIGLYPLQWALNRLSGGPEAFAVELRAAAVPVLPS